MRKSLLRLSAYLFLGVGLFSTVLTSCSNDDNALYTQPFVNGTVHGITFEELSIDPQIKNSNATYTWRNNTLGVISNEEVLHYTFTKPGTYELALSVGVPGNNVPQVYLYTVVIDKSSDYNYVRLDLSSFDLSNGIDTAGGKIWEDTYAEVESLQSGIFSFKHYAVPSWYYWTGFTVSNSSDNVDHGNDSANGGWLSNQWGTMPKGGVDGVGKPFLVSFADHKPHESLLQVGEVIDVDLFQAVVTLEDGAYKAVSTDVAISPWPYYGVLNGDSFARKFEKGDYFALHVYGVDKDKKLTSAKPITHYFVDFRNGVNTINTDWNTVDLSALGEVKYLLFFLETTDVGQYGANTALYFTMDNLTVDKIEK